MDLLKKAIADGSANVNVTLSAADLRQIVAEIVADVREQTISELEQSAGKRFLTRKEAMSLLGVSETTMVRWSNDGYLVPAKVGAKCMYRASEIYNLMQNP